MKTLAVLLGFKANANRKSRWIITEEERQIFSREFGPISRLLLVCIWQLQLQLSLTELFLILLLFIYVGSNSLAEGYISSEILQIKLVSVWTLITEASVLLIWLQCESSLEAYSSFSLNSQFAAPHSYIADISESHSWSFFAVIHFFKFLFSIESKCVDTCIYSLLRKSM